MLSQWRPSKSCIKMPLLPDASLVSACYFSALYPRAVQNAPPSGSIVIPYSSDMNINTVKTVLVLISRV